MYKKILFPTDGSEDSSKGKEYLLEVAGNFNSEVVLLYAYEVSDETTRLVSKFDKTLSQQLGEMEKYTINYGIAILDKIKDELENEEIKVKTIIAKGKPGPEIIKTIDNEKCDLVIMSSRGSDLLKSILIGSVSNYVLHHTHCPIMLIH